MNKLTHALAHANNTCASQLKLLSLVTVMELQGQSRPTLVSDLIVITVYKTKSNQMVDNWNFGKYDHVYARWCPSNKVGNMKRHYTSCSSPFKSLLINSSHATFRKYSVISALHTQHSRNLIILSRKLNGQWINTLLNLSLTVKVDLFCGLNRGFGYRGA